MLAARRHERIASSVHEAGVVSTDELARLLEVSVETVRRDLIALERAGKIVRVHGGATRRDGPIGEEASFADRRDTAVDDKRAIGRAAAALVRPGQTIVLDVGTTALEVARALPEVRLTVATCSLLVAAELAGRRAMTVLVSGGQVREGDLALSNAGTVAFFADLRADVAFLGSGGVDARAGLTDYHVDEVATRRTILANTVRSYVLADAHKLAHVAPHRVCPLGDVDGLITTGRVPAAIVKAVQSRGGTVVRAG